MVDSDNTAGTSVRHVCSERPSLAFLTVSEMSCSAKRATLSTFCSVVQRLVLLYIHFGSDLPLALFDTYNGIIKSV